MLSIFIFGKSHAQIEKYEKVILTRYFKPQVTYTTMVSPEFKNNELKADFFNYLNQTPSTLDDFRNFISFHPSNSLKEIPFRSFSKVPKNPLIPDNSFGSMYKTYFKFFVAPILLKKVKKQKERIMTSVESQLGNFAQSIAKERIMDIWGYKKNNCFDYNTLFDEAKKNSNDLDDLISENSAVSKNIYKDLMPELINRNFIIIYNLRECMNFEEFYNAHNTPERRRLAKDGITMLIEAYIFKINWSKNDQQYFFDNCWFDNTTPEKRDKALEAYNAMRINLELVDITSDEVTERYFELKDYEEMGEFEELWRRYWNPIRYNRNQKLLKENNYDEYKNKINQYSIQVITDNIHENVRLNIDHFKLRSILSEDNGYYTSSIGKKESLYRNQRFVAYELQQKSNGEIVKKYKGVLSSRKPADNLRDNSIKSNFKQERGFKLYDGMIIEEQPLSIYGFSFAYLQPVTALRDNTVNFLISLGIYNFNYSRHLFLKGISLDLFGLELSSGTQYGLFNVNWRPSIYRTLIIPKVPYVNLNLGVSLNTLSTYYLTGANFMGGINLPLRSNSSIQINCNYGKALNPYRALMENQFGTYIESTKTYDFDYQSYDKYRFRIEGISIEAKFIYSPSKRNYQTLRDRKYRI